MSKLSRFKERLMKDYQVESYPDGKGRTRNGSPLFYKLLEEAAETHDRKSHDYASNDNPSGNYHFAGLLASLFSHSHYDAGFIGRIGEKIYRLANLEKSGKTVKNESIEDTEIDIFTITGLWMADRRARRLAISQKEIQVGQTIAGAIGTFAGVGRVNEPTLQKISSQALSEILEHESSLSYTDRAQLIKYLERSQSDLDTTRKDRETSRQ